MSGMGPPPKAAHQRARRNATVPMTALPAEGRTGAPQKWPLPENVAMVADIKLAKARIASLTELLADAVTARDRSKHERALGIERRKLAHLEEAAKVTKKLERELWTDLWKTPQAIEWERLSWSRTVAQYVRWKIAAELGDLDSSKEARQLEDRLGLNPLALLRLRWQIGEREAAIARPSSQSAARRRYGNLRVVASGS
jgi:hypothetical protein